MSESDCFVADVGLKGDFRRMFRFGRAIFEKGVKWKDSWKLEGRE